jgi:hypothetical protein
MLLEGCYFMPGVKHPFRQKDAKAWNLKNNFFSDSFKADEQGEVKIPYKYKCMKAEKVPEVLRGEGGAGTFPSK